MTEATGHMPERDALAAEYVLGTLPLAERLTAEALIESDATFRALVEDWQTRLAPLAEDYEDVTPPPGLFRKVESRLFPEPEPQRRAGWVWGALTGLALALVAAVVISLTLAPQAPLVATLTGEGQTLTVAARYDAAGKELIVERTAGPAAEADKDYELWLIPAGKSAVSIGLVREATLAIPVEALPPGTTLAITLEPRGGSPTGVATGPLLVAGVIGG
ncbi:MAG: anti-sigma factor [Rhodobacteraceae bacterium]|nr:anti-sigma factor [Paracoccaceae bacterium]